MNHLKFNKHTDKIYKNAKLATPSDGGGLMQLNRELLL